MKIFGASGNVVLCCFSAFQCSLVAYVRVCVYVPVGRMRAIFVGAARGKVRLLCYIIPIFMRNYLLARRFPKLLGVYVVHLYADHNMHLHLLEILFVRNCNL